MPLRLYSSGSVNVDTGEWVPEQYSCSSPTCDYVGRYMIGHELHFSEIEQWVNDQENREDNPFFEEEDEPEPTDYHPVFGESIGTEQPWEEPPDSTYTHYYENRQYHDCGPCAYCERVIHMEDRRAQERVNEKINNISLPQYARSTDEPSHNTLTLDAKCTCFAHKAIKIKSKYGHVPMIDTVNYSYKPYWQLHRAKKEIFGPPTYYYLGVELETDNYTVLNSGGIRYSPIQRNEANAMAMPEEFWVPKEDSSISGTEFVSMPATLAWWREHRNDLKKMFTALLHAGYRSHDNNACGMHINISPQAFENAQHLYRMLTLLHIDLRWSLIMSQRRVDGMHSYYRPHDGTKPRYRMRAAEEAMKHGYTSLVDKHSILSFPDGQRFEFRLPRGTLRLDRFYKNLEWTVAMIEYTRNAKLRDSRPKKFMAWVRQNWIRFPTLHRYIKERFNKEYNPIATLKPPKKKKPISRTEQTLDLQPLASEDILAALQTLNNAATDNIVLSNWEYNEEVNISRLNLEA